jgi:hypothetical protein
MEQNHLLFHIDKGHLFPDKTQEKKEEAEK